MMTTRRQATAWAASVVTSWDDGDKPSFTLPTLLCHGLLMAAWWRGEADDQRPPTAEDRKKKGEPKGVVQDGGKGAQNKASPLRVSGLGCGYTVRLHPSKP